MFVEVGSHCRKKGNDPHRHRLQPLAGPRGRHEARLPGTDLDPREVSAVGRRHRLIDHDVGPGVGGERDDVGSVGRHRHEVPVRAEDDEPVARRDGRRRRGRLRTVRERGAGREGQHEGAGHEPAEAGHVSTL